jgi:hypothetical protein
MIRRRPLVIAGTGFLAVICAWILLSGRATALLDSFNSCTNQGYPTADTNPPICSDGHDAMLGPSRPPEPSALPIQSEPFELLVDGDSGGSYPQKQEVITTPTGWRSYWTAVHASLASLPPLLPVDFTTANVVALSEGSKTTSGYSLKVTNITAGPAGTTVDYTESVPTVTCPVTNTATNRYLIVRTGLLPAPVSFRATTESRHCAP